MLSVSPFYLGSTAVREFDLVSGICEAALRGDLPNLKAVVIEGAHLPRGIRRTLRVPPLEMFSGRFSNSEPLEVEFPRGLPAQSLMLSGLRPIVVPALAEAGEVRFDGAVSLGCVVSTSEGAPVGAIVAPNVVLANTHARQVTARYCKMIEASCAGGHVETLVVGDGNRALPDCDHEYAIYCAEEVNMGAELGENVYYGGILFIRDGDRQPAPDGAVKLLFWGRNTSDSWWHWPVEQLTYVATRHELEDDGMWLIDCLNAFSGRGTEITVRFDMQSLDGAPHVSEEQIARVDRLERRLREAGYGGLDRFQLF